MVKRWDKEDHSNEKSIEGSGFRFDLGRSIRKRRHQLRLSMGMCEQLSDGYIGKGMWSYYENGTDPGVAKMCVIMKVLRISDKPWSLLLRDLLAGRKVEEVN